MVGSERACRVVAVELFPPGHDACSLFRYVLHERRTQHDYVCTLTHRTGETKHVIQGLISAGGMWAQRSRKDKPLQKFEQWLEATWWPSTAGRVPKNVGLVCTYHF